MPLNVRSVRHMSVNAAIKVGQDNGHVLQEVDGKNQRGTVWRCLRCDERGTYAGGELIESLLEETCVGETLRDPNYGTLIMGSGNGAVNNSLRTPTVPDVEAVSEPGQVKPVKRVPKPTVPDL